MTASPAPSVGGVPPRYYRRRGRLALLVPNTWGSIHGWLTVVFWVATFGPMFHLWATSTRLIAGWPVTIGWILAWMILQTLNLIAFYFTTVRPSVRFIETNVSPEDGA